MKDGIVNKAKPEPDNIGQQGVVPSVSQRQQNFIDQTAALKAEKQSRQQPIKPEKQPQQTASEPAQPDIPNQVKAPEQPAGTPTGVVNQKTDTVAGQMESLLGGDSKYIELARKRAQQYANSRGLINSTIAAQAGEDAAINAAMPIAQQDAQTNAKFSENVQSTNLNMQLNEFNAQLERETEAFSTQLKADLDKALSNNKLSNEFKVQIVSAINATLKDAQDRITEISLSDRSAAQQAAAINDIKAERDATLAIYQAALGDIPDWQWTTDFTPESVSTAEANNYWNAPGGAKPLTEPRVGTVINGMRYQGNGVWEPERQYDPYD